MKLTIALVVVLLIVVTIACRRMPISKVNNNLKASADSSSHTNESPYEGLRNLALNATISELHLSISADKQQVYGIVMDIGLEEGIATIVSYSTGDASMYTSSGGGIIGGGSNEKVSEAAKNFVSTAQKFIGKATNISETPLPAKGQVTFYLLTSKGKKVVREELSALDNNTSYLRELFFAGNEVITELRLLDKANTK